MTSAKITAIILFVMSSSDCYGRHILWQYDLADPYIDRIGYHTFSRSIPGDGIEAITNIGKKLLSFPPDSDESMKETADYTTASNEIESILPELSTFPTFYDDEPPPLPYFRQARHAFAVPQFTCGVGRLRDFRGRCVGKTFVDFRGGANSRFPNYVE